MIISGLIQRSRELGRRQTIAGINYLDGDCQTVTAEAPAATSHSVIYTNTSAGKSQTLPAQVYQPKQKLPTVLLSVVD